MFGFKRSMVQATIILTWALKYYTFGNLLLWWILSILLTLVIILTVTTYDHDYWSARGVFSPPAWPIVGHILSVVTFKEQGGMCFKRVYETYRNERFLGTHQFYQRTLVIRDPELIKRVCVVDFQHFVDRGFFFNKDVDPLAGSVLFLRGNEWRKLRAKISPIFSPNKLRGMFPLIDNTANDFVIRVRELLAKATVEANTKNNILINKENNNSHNKINITENGNKNNGVKENDAEIIGVNINGKTVKNDGVKISNGVPLNGKVTKNDDIKISNGVTLNGKISKNDDKKISNGVTLNGKTTKNDDVKETNDVTLNGKITKNDDVKKTNEVILNGIITKNNDEKTSNVKMMESEDEEKYQGNDEDISAVVDSEKLVGGYTADAIVPCAFGLKSGVMYNDKDPFAVALQAFYEMSVFNIFEKTMRQFWPAFVLFFRMRIIPKKTHDFFYNIVTSVLRAREKGEQEKRGDFIDMMMALREDNNNKVEGDDVEITDMVISANAFIIFLGGFETTSSTLAFLCLELAAHPHVQEKMREEIRSVLERKGEEINYEVLQELTYMEMVIQETLRLYPPFPSIQRLCTKDYMIPGTSVRVERGTVVLFPTLGIQRDEQYFEHADRFMPERWLTAAPPPGVYMPFGDGPRYCIGKRFAMIQMKCCLIRLLQHVRISPANANMLDERLGAPFAADPRSPLTLHPADSLVKLTLL